MIALLIRDGIYTGYHETITAEELDEIGYDYVFVDEVPSELIQIPANTTVKVVSKEPLEIERVSAVDPPKSPELLRLEALEADNLTLMLALTDIYEQLIATKGGDA